MHHRIRAREARRAGVPHTGAHATTPLIERDPAIVSSFLSDAAHVPGGFAAGVTFPHDEAAVADAVARATRVLPVGAQSSLTGGATPRGELILSTRALTTIHMAGPDRVRAGAGVPLAVLQRTIGAHGVYYPPVPTFDGAFVGGTIATNAAGAATFKHGSTRKWVESVTVVLANGDVLDVDRGACVASPSGEFEVQLRSGAVLRVPVPSYVMPDVPKLSAGYYARPGMDLVDLFIGSEGTLGVVVAATLKVAPRTPRCVALIPCTGDAQAVRVTAALRREARDAWQGHGVLDVAAVEYMDARALQAVPDDAFARSGIPRPTGETVMLLAQIEVPHGEESALQRLDEILHACGVEDDPVVASAHDERAAQKLFDLREAVPVSVNALVAAAKARAHHGIEKTAGDFVVPFETLEESIRLYRSAFETRGLAYAIWGHVSDGNLHPNVVPRALEDVERGREALLEAARQVIVMGGAPLAEHGVGRSVLKQQLLRELYGHEGIEQMRAVKRALDPEWKLSPGVLFPEP